MAKVTSHLSQDNAACTCTLGTAAGSYVIYGVHGGYSDDPSGGKRLTVTIDGTVSWATPITKGGAFDFGYSRDGWEIMSTSSGVSVSLPASGTDGVTGDLNIVWTGGGA